MKNSHRNPRSDVVLVDLDGRYALIDPQSERIHIVNEGAAWVWRHLDAGIDETSPGVAAFLAFLEQQGLIRNDPSSAQGEARPPMVPAVLGTEPLEVAANNSAASADPFFGG